MSFSFMYIELPEGVLLGQGWIYDMLHPIMTSVHDTILLYAGTWLLVAARSTWYYWLILIGLFYVGLRICLNLIVAFQGAGDRLSDGIVETGGPDDELDEQRWGHFLGGVEIMQANYRKDEWDVWLERYE